MNKLLKRWALLSGLMAVMVLGAGSVSAQNVIINNPLDFSVAENHRIHPGQTFIGKTTTGDDIEFTVGGGTYVTAFDRPSGDRRIVFFIGNGKRGEDASVYFTFCSTPGGKYSVDFNAWWYTINDSGHRMVGSAIDGAGIGGSVLGGTGEIPVALGRQVGGLWVGPQKPNGRFSFIAKSHKTTIQFLGKEGYDSAAKDMNLSLIQVSGPPIICPSDNQPPTADAGRDITIEAPSLNGALVTLDGTGSHDPDGDKLSYNWFAQGVTFDNANSPTPEGVFPVGVTQAVLYVEDGKGGKAKDAVSITVLKPKNNPPVAHAGPDQIVEATSSSGASVTLDGTASKDKDGDKLSFNWVAQGVTFDNANSPTPEGVFPVGTTQAVLYVDDGKGGKAKDAVQIRVVDTTPPDVSFSLSTNTLWPANHKMVQVASGILASDIVDGEVKVKISVKSDEDINGTGDGNTEVDWEISGGDVYLRAERDGGQDGRVYTVTVVATDAAGNTTTATGTVEVPHSQQVASAGNSGNGKGKAKKIVIVQQSVTPSVIADATPEIAGLLVDVAGQADMTPRMQIPVVENHTFSLSQNHPNPFNPETVIGYALGEASDVRLIIYNVLGQQVRELVNASQSPGQYSVRWDGRNALGAQVTSGVYVYRLVAGTQVEMRKMILLK